MITRSHSLNFIYSTREKKGVGSTYVLVKHRADMEDRMKVITKNII